MRERPILFTDAMVRALLNGSKTQTRRFVKPVPPSPEDVQRIAGIDYCWIAPDRPGIDYHRPAGPVWAVRKLMGMEPHLHCPYGQPGDRLWVRETFVQGFPYDATQDRYLQYDEDGNTLPMQTWYRATDPGIGWADGDGWETNVPWRPSIHMPRSACRLVLDITSVHVERLQDINDAGAIAEGVGLNPPAEGVHVTTPESETLPRVMFRALWDKINGAGAWEANPWVWVVEFRVLAQPTNQPGGAHHA